MESAEEFEMVILIPLYTFHRIPLPFTIILTLWIENLTSGFPTKRVSNQSPQLQRLARKFKFHLKQAYV